MRKVLKTLAGVVLACAITFTAMPQTAFAAGITTVNVGQTKKVQSKYYKGAKAHKAKVTCHDKRFMGSAQGYNVYYVDFTLQNTKFTTDECIGINKECSRKGLSSLSTYTWVLTDSQGNDINGTRAAVSAEYSSITKSSSEFTKKAVYRSGYYRYHCSVSTPKSRNFKLMVVCPAYSPDVCVGIAGLKKGQPSYSALNSYQYGYCTFNQAGFGGSKKNIAAIRLQ
ncbi:hypothetical protein SAMN04487770_101449 [Butyrivibrio sp. ob235]|uniref:hypothetical protein n=1 Tax=Butyrivibrio sp. ob235 TaxID=1761780 RepID=UPI0008BFDF17|nr:hypothetical protein [Butyrivibrio sp. ob235]SEK46322.1 hypothetical protein SAMN04487770_101449 [Butyrivibrio sp. ob235]